MKSQFFSEFDLGHPANSGFKAHLDVMLRLDSTNVRKILALAKLKLLNEPKKQLDERLAALAKDAGVHETEAGNVLTVLWFMFRHLTRQEKVDRPEDLSADVQAAGLVEEGDRPKLDALLTELVKEAERNRPLARRREYEAGVLPSLRSYGTTAELRAVFDSEYDESQEVDDYSPKLLSTVPIISVHIGVDTGTPEDFFFQATASELELLVKELQAALKEARILQDGTLQKPD